MNLKVVVGADRARASVIGVLASGASCEGPTGVGA